MPEDKVTPAIKIKRKRRRLYESVDKSAAVQTEGSNEAPKQSSSKQFASGQSHEGLATDELENINSVDSDLSDISSDIVVEPTSSLDTQVNKEEAGRKIIRKYAYLSTSAALLPIPTLDFIAVTALEIKMIHELCHEYQVEFSKERVKAIIGSLVGGLHASLIAGSLIKSIPFLGMAVASVSVGAISGAITYAVGIVFLKHFDLRGTLFDFNPSSYQKKFDDALKEGKTQVKKEGAA